MILYLSSNQNIGLFDFLEKEYGHTIKKYNVILSLRRFTISDMKNLTHLSHIIIDLATLTDSDSEIIEAIDGLIKMYSSIRIIIFAEGKTKDYPLLQKLFNIGVYNIITAKTIDSIRKETLLCVNGDGMSYECALQYVATPINVDKKVEVIPDYTFICESVRIGVANTISGSGATTTALNIAHFLSSLGALVYYCNMNDNHIRAIQSYLGAETNDRGQFMYKDVVYCSNVGYVPLKGGNFIVIDFRKQVCEVKDKISKADVKIICGSTKPYNLVHLTNAISDCKDINYNLILTCTPKNEQQNLIQRFSKDNCVIYFPKYSDDLFDSKVNSNIWHEIFKEYIISTKKPTNILNTEEKRK